MKKKYIFSIIFLAIFVMIGIIVYLNQNTKTLNNMKQHYVLYGHNDFDAKEHLKWIKSIKSEYREEACNTFDILMKIDTQNNYKHHEDLSLKSVANSHLFQINSQEIIIFSKNQLGISPDSTIYAINDIGHYFKKNQINTSEIIPAIFNFHAYLRTYGNSKTIHDTAKIFVLYTKALKAGTLTIDDVIKLTISISSRMRY